MKKFFLIFLSVLVLFSSFTFAAIPTDSVLVSYGFDGTTGTNKTIVDSSNKTNTGFSQLNPTYVSGKIGNALNLTNMSNQQYVMFSDNSSVVRTSGSYTINSWIQFTGLSDGLPQYIFSNEEGASQYRGIEYGYAIAQGGIEARNYQGSSYTFAMQNNPKTLLPGKWTMITLVYDSGNNRARIYINGTQYAETTTISAPMTASSSSPLIGKRPSNTFFANFTIDEFTMWNVSLNDSQITELYNFGAGLAYPFTNVSNATNPPLISFYSQSPLNITSTSIFNANINVTYNYSIVNLSSSQLNYSVTGLSCIQSVNGSCNLANNSFSSVSQTSNDTVENYSLISFSLSENNVYPFVANLNTSLFNQAHNAFNSSLSNEAVSFSFVNVSTVSNSQNILELMVNSSGQSRVYGCNSSYDFSSSYLSSSNCQELGNINSASFNHSHGSFSSHNLIPFNVINGKVSGVGISVTSNMTFIVRRISGFSQTWYVSNFSRTNAVQTTGNNGLTWTSQVYTIDSHLHQYPSTGVFINYFAQGFYGSILNYTSSTSAQIQVTQLGPNPPIITVPTPGGFNQSTQFMNITWLNATPYFNTTTITKYNISLLNGDGSFNRTISNSVGLNNSYLWDVYNENLSLGTYFVRVYAFDSFNLSSFDQESFDLLSNSRFNFTAKDNYSGASVSNWTFNMTDLTTLQMVRYTVNGSYVSIDAVKGRSYNIDIDTVGYAVSEFNVTKDNTTYQNYTMPLYLTNSIYITILDEDTGNLINDTNVSITATSSTYTASYMTGNGTLYISNIPAGFYDLNFQGNNLSTKDYFLTVTDRTTQTLTARLGRGYSIIGVYVRDAGDNPITQALITIQRLINTSYITIGQAQVDGVGYARFQLKDGLEYLWTVDATSYAPKQFFLRPYASNQPYKFKLALNTTATYTTYSDFVSYDYTPKGSSLSPNMTTFTWTVISKNVTFGSNSILWFAQNCNGNLINNSGSPSGGTITRTVNLSGFNGVYTCINSFQVDTFSPVFITLPYAVKSYTLPTNTSIINSANQFKNDNNDEAWLGIIATFLAFVAALIVKEVTQGNPTASAIAGAIVLTCFGFLGWLAWSMCVIIDVIVFILFSNDRSGY